MTFRGNARQDIFLNDADRQRLKLRLEESADRFDVTIHAYCFMTNHAHLLVGTPRGNLDRFMGSVLTGYTVYFNRRHERVGHLMQGRYGAEVVGGDDYLLRLSRYIHLNPVRVKGWADKEFKQRRDRLRTYRWSSYRSYAGFDAAEPWVKYTALRAMVPGGAPENALAYRRFTEAGMTKTDKEMADLVRMKCMAIGSDSFVAEVHKRHEELTRRAVREDVSLRGLRQRTPPENIRAAVCRACGVPQELMTHRKLGVLPRALYAWSLQKHGGLTQRQVAQELGVGTGAAVCHMLRALRKDKQTPLWMAKLNLIFKG